MTYPKPRDHQKREVVEHLHDPRRFWFWEPRTGKTLEGGYHIALWQQQCAVRRTVIVAPLISCRTVWLPELSRIGIVPSVLDRGTPHAVQTLKELGDGIVIVNYDILGRQDKQGKYRVLHALRRWGPQAVIFDECHRLRRAGSGRSHAAYYLANDPQVRFVRGLTGTPTPRSYMNLYCLAPDTLVLKTDLCWVRVAALHVGDEVIAFDETAPSPKRRKFRGAEVGAVGSIACNAYRIVTGHAIVEASADHLWLCRTRSSRRISWVRTADLTSKHWIIYFGAPWTTEKSWDAGYLAGIYDGEGSISTQQGGVLSFSQKPGKVLDAVMQMLRDRDFYPHQNVSKSSGVVNARLCGVYQILRFLGTVRPQRLLPKVSQVYEGVQAKSWATPGFPYSPVFSVTPIGRRNLIGVQTSTGTLLANGLFSHNSQFKIVAPEVFGTDQNAFLQRYIATVQASRDGGRREVGYHNLPELREKVRAHAGVVRLDDCFDIPETQEIVRKIDLDPHIMAAYRQLVKQHVAELALAPDQQITITGAHVFPRLLHLHELCGGTATVGEERQWVHDRKLKACLEEVETVLSSHGQRVVVFYRYVPEGQRLETEINRLFGDVARRLDGSITGDARTALIETFNEERATALRALLVQEQTGAESISLRGADHAIFYSSWFDAGIHTQARLRIFKERRAAGHKLTYTYLLCNGTIDVTIARVLRGRHTAQERLIFTSYEAVAYGEASP